MSVTATLAQDVLTAAGRGESLIAVGADKRPWYSWKRYQTQPADTAQLLTWTKDPRTSAFAIVTGAISGFVVVDFDEQGVHVVEQNNLDPHVRTGRGGYHLRVTHPGFRVATQNSKVTKLLAEHWPGVDIRGDGGYAIEYGATQHGHYQHLRDLSDLDPISALPRDLAAALGLLGADALDALAGHDASTSDKAERAEDGRYHEGHRHRHLLEVASAMAGRGHTEPEILAELRRINPVDCVPPKDDAQLVDLAKDVAKRYGTAQPGLGQRRRADLERLETLLRLAQAGAHIHELRMIGNGPGAAVEIELADGTLLETDHFGDLWTHTGLAKFVSQSTGINAGGITKVEAEDANALIRRLAAIRYATGARDLGREHGLDFLRQATVETFDLTDRASRYEAFARLDAIDPVRAADPYLRERGEVTPTVAACSIVLRHTDGTRLVHCGWFFSHVRQTGKVSHPGELARRVELAGWARAGTRGRVKATSPGLGHPIILPFWRVEPGWEAL